MLENLRPVIYSPAMEQRIRELCVRVRDAEGADFSIALLELANALDLFLADGAGVRQACAKSS